MKLSGMLWAAALFLVGVVADTEIRNFRLPLPTFDDSPLPDDYKEPLRTPWRRTRVLMSSSEDLIGVKLDLDNEHKDWTIRASWAGSSPVRLNMTLVPTRSPITVILILQSSQLTPHFPHPLLDSLPLPCALKSSVDVASPDFAAGSYETAIDLALEPLIYGVLPESVIPTVYWIIGAALVSAATVPLFIRFFEAFGSEPQGAPDTALTGGAKAKTD